ncbi:MAG: YbjQ family protein [Paludibacteraceae bacterium]|nr:YbjQ family protein [Paludibacteraceae bacterium]
MIITTTPTIEGHSIREYKGLVSGEVIFGMNFLKDFGASLRDIFGGRTESYEKAMLEGRETAEREMRERAENMGANAIVGVSYGYETMGQSNGMIMISISGTAVVID